MKVVEVKKRGGEKESEMKGGKENARRSEGNVVVEEHGKNS